MSKVLFSQSGDQTILHSVVDQLVHHLNDTPILCLKGNLGAGKTTLAQYLFKALNVGDQVTSPTFNIVNTYKTDKGETVYHFDLYRIKHAEELEEMGFYEYLDSDCICVLEWPEIAEDYLQDKHLELEILHQDNSRDYILSLIE